MNIEQLTLCNRYKCDLIPKNNNSLSGSFDQVMENLVPILFTLNSFSYLILQCSLEAKWFKFYIMKLFSHQIRCFEWVFYNFNVGCHYFELFSCRTLTDIEILWQYPPPPIILLLLILQSTEEREHDPWLKSVFDLIILIFHVMKFRAI